jgi:hypothetical protein
MKKDFIKFSLKWLTYWITFSLWVVWVIYASSLLTPASEWDPLTLTAWNNVVNKVNEISGQIETVSQQQGPQGPAWPAWPWWWWITEVSTQQTAANLATAMKACADMQTTSWDGKVRRLPSVWELEYVRRNKSDLLEELDPDINSTARLWTSTPYGTLGGSWYVLRLSDTTWYYYGYGTNTISFRCVY